MLILFNLHFSSVAPNSVNAPVSEKLNNNGSCRSRYCKRIYNNGTISVNIGSNGSGPSRYCQRLHLRERVMIICAISTIFVKTIQFYFLAFDDRISGS